MSAIRYNVLNDSGFPHGCYRTLAEYKGSGFLGISVVCIEFLHENMWLAQKNVAIYRLFVGKSVLVWGYSLKKV